MKVLGREERYEAYLKMRNEAERTQKEKRKRMESPFIVVSPKMAKTELRYNNLSFNEMRDCCYVLRPVEFISKPIKTIFNVNKGMIYLIAYKDGTVIKTNDFIPDLETYEVRQLYVR